MRVHTRVGDPFEIFSPHIYTTFAARSHIFFRSVYTWNGPLFVKNENILYINVIREFCEGIKAANTSHSRERMYKRQKCKYLKKRRKMLAIYTARVNFDGCDIWDTRDSIVIFHHCQYWMICICLSMKWIWFSLLRQEKNGGFVEILFLFSTSIFSRL